MKKPSMARETHQPPIHGESQIPKQSERDIGSSFSITQRDRTVTGRQYKYWGRHCHVKLGVFSHFVSLDICVMRFREKVVAGVNNE